MISALRYSSIQEGRGCPVCTGRKHHDLPDYQQLAARHGIEFVGPVPLTSRHQATWRLPDGRVFQAPYRNLDVRRLSLKQWLERLPELAASDFQALPPPICIPLEIRALLVGQEQGAADDGFPPATVASAVSAETGQDIGDEPPSKPAPNIADLASLFLSHSRPLSSAVTPGMAMTNHAIWSSGGVIGAAAAWLRGSDQVSPLLSAAAFDLAAGPSEESQRAYTHCDG